MTTDQDLFMEKQPNRFLALILPFGLGYLICTVFRSINAVLGPVLVTTFGFSNAQLGALTSVYVLSFAFSQIPLGLLLDRYGPRPVQAALFILGGLSTIGFAMSSSFALFTAMRALLGIGMSAGLMGAFKAVSLSADSREIPKFNSIILGFGGVGALMATSPTQWFMQLFGWRSLCLAVGILTLLVALLILWMAPKTSSTTKAAPLGQQLREYLQVFKHPVYLRLSPMIVTGLGGFIAVQGLWEGTWLQHVALFSPVQTGHVLFLTAIAMTVGMLSGGVLAKIANRFVIPLHRVLAMNGLCLVVVLFLVLFNNATFQVILWMLYGLFGQAIALGYAAMAQSFPRELAGRVNTGINVFVFLFAFVSQYAIGVVIHSLHQKGMTLLAAYQYAFAGLLILQVMALVCYVLYRPRYTRTGQ